MPVAPPGETGFDPQSAWALHRQVALRPEEFGALAYHYGNRRLVFLKSPALVALVSSLDRFDSADRRRSTPGRAGPARSVRVGPGRDSRPPR